MNEIGGYFQIAEREYADNFPHKKGVLLNTGRNALEYILRSIKHISLRYLPYYTCEAVLEPIKRLSIPHRFYHINSQLEIAEIITLDNNEYIIANNYFGIKDQYIVSLYSMYGDCLIVDCTQSFFCPIIKGLKAFYSPRKFVGVADGGIAYLGDEEGIDLSKYEIEPTEHHSSHLFIRKECGAEAGFCNYKDDEMALDNQPIRLMSDVTKDALFNIDYDIIRAQRVKNFNMLDEALCSSNQLRLSFDFESPMVYPYFTVDNELRNRLIANQIYVATYWPNVLEWCKKGDVEYDLVKQIIPLPIDQRYGVEEMNRILEVI